MHLHRTSLFRTRLRLLQLIPLGILLLTSSAGFAKSNHEGWYQVEMLVFVRDNPITSEVWPKELKLRYPAKWVSLKDPAAPQITVNSPADGADTAVADLSPASAPDLIHQAYWQLPISEWQLGFQDKRLRQSPGYSVLFHQSWRQIIGNSRSATSLLINGGASYGNHHQLEGSIKLSVATYLKVETNFWFSNFVPYTPEMANSGWPELPEFPRAQALPPKATETGQADTEAAVSQATADYVPSRIVLMQQERDMRSREVHYLDHPLLGVIIQIVPYSPGPEEAAPSDINDPLPSQLDDAPPESSDD